MLCAPLRLADGRQGKGRKASLKGRDIAYPAARLKFARLHATLAGVNRTLVCRQVFPFPWAGELDIGDAAGNYLHGKHRNRIGWRFATRYRLKGRAVNDLIFGIEGFE